VITKILKKQNEYRDSVFLMVINQEVKSTPGIEELVIMMGTDNNKGIMRDVGFTGSDIELATANDMVICVRAHTEEAINEALSQIEEMLTRKATGEQLEDVYKTVDSLVREIPNTNLAIISVPGQFAARETRKALRLGLNVLLFSDNVSVDEEIELKKLASELDRIVMGPDCGTAIINQVPLAFANAVNPGPIGIVAAAGTGMQEVVKVIDRQGLGISQGIGTGGRDLSDEVGGISMLKGIEILEQDKKTEIIVLISKPPGSVAVKKVLDRVAESPKKMVVCFFGGYSELIARSGAIAARYLEEAALLAVASVEGRRYEYKNFSVSESKLESMLNRETGGIGPHQKFVRGLYSGGTLCDEAMLILKDFVGGVYSNIPLEPENKLPDLSKGYKHSCIDLGDDYFTRGRPHPMISPETRKQFIVNEADDPEVAVLLLDIVLGFGAHPDMAGALTKSITAAKSKVEEKGGYLSVVASVCGTSGDPQGIAEQTKKLEDTGVIVMPSNSQAARFAGMVCAQIDTVSN